MFARSERGRAQIARTSSYAHSEHRLRPRVARAFRRHGWEVAIAASVRRPAAWRAGSRAPRHPGTVCR